jgi:methyl-accepting chemotaxis protein
MTNALNHNKANPPRVADAPPRKAGYLRHLFLRCFLMIALVTMAVGIGLAMDSGIIPDGFDGMTNVGAAGLYDTLRWRIALGAVMIISVAGGIFLFLNRRIANPLEKTAEATGHLAEGNLGATLPGHLPYEIGRIGDSINGLSVNFQETLILVWNQTENAIARIQRTTEKISPNGQACSSEDMVADLHAVRQDLETMQMMVRTFDLYDVAITDNDTLAAKKAVKPLN